MNIHEAIETLSDLISHWHAIGAIFDEEAYDAHKAIEALEEYIRINEGGSSND